MFRVIVIPVAVHSAHITGVPRFFIV